MKNLLGMRSRQKTATLFSLLILLLVLFAGCDDDDPPVNNPPVFELSTVATGLSGPMGIELDSDGNIWVAIPGTANNDGKIVVIDVNGKQYDAIVNLPSRLHPEGDELEGPAHLLLDGDILYVLAANYLYGVNISGYTLGQTPIDATTLSGEDIAAFVLDYPFIINFLRFPPV